MLSKKALDQTEPSEALDNRHSEWSEESN